MGESKQLDQEAWIAQTWGKIDAARAAVPPGTDPPGYDRASYEAACKVAGVAVLPDSEIADSYAVKYGDWMQVTVAPDLAVRMTLAGWRRLRLDHEAEADRQARLDALDALEAEQAAAAPRCDRCGRPATMNASLGPACDDCYDDLSG